MILLFKNDRGKGGGGGGAGPGISPPSLDF